jgi:hypothetical protein
MGVVNRFNAVYNAEVNGDEASVTYTLRAVDLPLTCSVKVKVSLNAPLAPLSLLLVMVTASLITIVITTL